MSEKKEKSKQDIEDALKWFGDLKKTHQIAVICFSYRNREVVHQAILEVEERKQ